MCSMPLEYYYGRQPKEPENRFRSTMKNIKKKIISFSTQVATAFGDDSYVRGYGINVQEEEPSTAAGKSKNNALIDNKTKDNNSPSTSNNANKGGSFRNLEIAKNSSGKADKAVNNGSGAGASYTRRSGKAKTKNNAGNKTVDDGSVDKINIRADSSGKTASAIVKKNGNKEKIFELLSDDSDDDIEIINIDDVKYDKAYREYMGFEIIG